MIGKGIREGSRHLPIRHLAGRATKSAGPKNYYGQAKAIYDAITKHWWHYTFDPVGAEVLTVKPERIFDVTLGRGQKDLSGYGDCDDIATASGALLNSIGLKTIIATTSRPGSPNIFDHVFVMVKAPNFPEWIPFDPVLYKRKGFGDIVEFQRLATWTLDGKLLNKVGQFPPRFDAVIRHFGNCQPKIEKNNLTGTGDSPKMYNNTQPNYFDFHDQGDRFGFFGEDITDPRSGRARISPEVLPDFGMHGIAGFGAYVDDMGYMSGAALPHITAEVDDSDLIGDTGLVRTKHFELDPDEYAYMLKSGCPRIGALALSDDGEIYTWQPNPDGLGGLFKRLARRVKKRVKRVGRRIKRRAKSIGRGIKRFAKRIGKTKVFRLGRRVLKTAMKYVKPLLKKYGGKIMQAVAPVAAMIPGAGPFISTALVVGGKAYDIAQKAKVVMDKFGKPIFKSIKQAKDFKSLLKNAARNLGKRGAKSILDKYAKSKGLAGFSGDDLETWRRGVQWRMVETPGYGWC